MNMGTSGRSACTSIGNFLFPSVAEGNKLASRKLGLFLVHACLGDKLANGNLLHHVCICFGK